MWGICRKAMMMMMMMMTAAMVTNEKINGPNTPSVVNFGQLHYLSTEVKLLAHI